jgi:hypothetical protein
MYGHEADSSRKKLRSDTSSMQMGMPGDGKGAGKSNPGAGPWWAKMDVSMEAT